MKRTDKSTCNEAPEAFVAAHEPAGARRRKSSLPRPSASGTGHRLTAMAACFMLAFGSNAIALPTGGAVSAGSAVITNSPGKTTITQSSQNAAINWQGFSVGQAEAVQFVQPNSGAVALNRVLGADPSSILGSLSANGKVFLINPNGILFGSGAQVNVAGLVASTLNLTDGDFMAGNYRFSGSGSGSVRNQGNINANGGYVALLGASVTNEGVISANLGSVMLAAGKVMTMDMAGDGLLNVTVTEGAINALVDNRGMIRADGGLVLLTTQAAGNLLQSAVNNTGVIQAQTIDTSTGVIKLLGDMQTGTANVSGTLDASAPNGGNGGFIETSAAHVRIAGDAVITTSASAGLMGHWLIDPQDFTIGSGATDNISGATLSALLVTNSVTITTNTGPDATVAGTPPVSTRNTATPGNGDINVNEAVTWTAAPTTTTLTLNALRDVNVNQAITATNGNVVICCGRDVNVNAPITTTSGSVLLSAGRNATLLRNALNPLTAITVTDGNLMICAANDVVVNGAAITLTRGSSIAAQSLGLSPGLVLSADTDGSGPGPAGGTVTFAAGTPAVVVTGPNAPATINYNPTSYTTPTNYAGNFTLTLGATLTQRMLVIPDGADKTFDGSTLTTLTGFKTTAVSGVPAGVTLVAGAGSSANFDTAAEGLNKPVTFTGYSLGGPAAASFALPQSCCGPIVGRTFANITPAPLPLIPGVVLPVPILPGAVVPIALAPLVPLLPGEVAVVTLPLPVEVAAVELPTLQNAVGTAPRASVARLNLSMVDAGEPPMQFTLAPVAEPVRQAPVVIEAPPVVQPPPPPPAQYAPPVRPARPARN